jgi:hypothetical protein
MELGQERGREDAVNLSNKRMEGNVYGTYVGQHPMAVSPGNKLY